MFWRRHPRREGGVFVGGLVGALGNSTKGKRVQGGDWAGGSRRSVERRKGALGGLGNELDKLVPPGKRCDSEKITR